MYCPLVYLRTSYFTHGALFPRSLLEARKSRVIGTRDQGQKQLRTY